MDRSTQLVILIKNIFFIGSETLSTTCYKLSDEYNICYIKVPIIFSNLQNNSIKSIPTIDGRNYLWSTLSMAFSRTT